ncbi:MAG: hypothetical protein ABUL63_05510, partial [Acidobacteriota bacterium]
RRRAPHLQDHDRLGALLGLEPDPPVTAPERLEHAEGQQSQDPESENRGNGNPQEALSRQCRFLEEFVG